MEKPLTPKQFKREIEKIIKGDINQDDPEMFHCVTDDLIEETLTKLGYGEGIELIKSRIRWCA